MMTDDELSDAFYLPPRPELGPAERILTGLRAVAARVRAEALEEAAEECDALASAEGIAQRCAAAIRARAAERGRAMSVISTEHLARLDTILYGRPAGRNIIGFAIEEIERLRAQGATLREQHRQAHENSAKIFSALVDISALTPLGGEVADYADVIAAVRALREDAERWRLARKWFRVMSPHIDGNHGWCPTGEWGRIKGPNIDTAIDEAMRKNAL